MKFHPNFYSARYEELLPAVRRLAGEEGGG
jgi:hypothetical protein